MAYLEENVSGGIRKAKKEVKKEKKEKKEARQRSCRAVVRLQSERSLLGVVKVTYCLQDICLDISLAEFVCIIRKSF